MGGILGTVYMDTRDVESMGRVWRPEYILEGRKKDGGIEKEIQLGKGL